MARGKIIFRNKNAGGGGGGGGARTLATIDDITWLGHVRFPGDGFGPGDNTVTGDADYMQPAITIRKVGGNLRFLTALFSSYYDDGKTDQVGDLIEWNAPTTWETGTASTTMTMITQATGTGAYAGVLRKWSSWTANSLLTSGDGHALGGLWWDQDNGGVWYTFWNYYGSSAFPFLGFTQLHDDGTVTKYGMWYYRGTSEDYQRSVAGYIIPLPENAQSIIGHPMAIGMYPASTVGNHGQFGISMHALTLPDFASLAANSSISQGLKLMDYSIAEAVVGDPNMHRNVNYHQVGTIHTPEVYYHFDSSAGTYTHTSKDTGSPTTGTWASNDEFGSLRGNTLLGDNGDALYLGVSSEDSALQNLLIDMSTPASGGTRIWEYSKGGGVWQTFSPTMGPGSALLGSTRNLGYWGTGGLSGFATDTINGSTKHWIRIKVTSTVTTPGTIGATGRINFSIPTLANPEPSGGIGRVHQTKDFQQGLIYWDNGTKHIILSFGRICEVDGDTVDVWYGDKEGYADGGLVHVADPADNLEDVFGYKSTGYKAALWQWDPAQIFEVANGTRHHTANGNGTLEGINPVAVDDWKAQWPNIPEYCQPNDIRPGVDGRRVNNSGGAYAIDPDTHILYWMHFSTVQGNVTTASTLQKFSLAE